MNKCVLVNFGDGVWYRCSVITMIRVPDVGVVCAVKLSFASTLYYVPFSCLRMGNHE